MKKRILFLCSQNKLRSPTAEAIFTDHPAIEVDSAGLNNDAIVPLSEEQVRWADLIIVMEKAHRNRLNRKFKKVLVGKRVAVLDIPDEYDYMEPSLIALSRTPKLERQESRFYHRATEVLEDTENRILKLLRVLRFLRLSVVKLAGYHLELRISG